MLLIGDIHGAELKYKEIVDKYEGSTIQLGDFGFRYDILDSVDPHLHKILGGNHDNYDLIHKYPHYLGDFGMHNNLFFVRGAYSIDKQYRTVGVSWWEQEELSYEQCIDCMHEYMEVQPNIVISHMCPFSVLNHLVSSPILCITGELLSALLDMWRPKLWIFAHMHQSKNFKTTIDKELPDSTIIGERGFNTTHFVCLNEFECCEIRNQ